MALKDTKAIAAIIPTSLHQVQTRIGATNKLVIRVLKAMQATQETHPEAVQKRIWKLSNIKIGKNKMNQINKKTG